MFGNAFFFTNSTISYDTDAQAYITAVETADGQALETGVKNAINDFVLGLKTDGLWSVIQASCILAGARTLAGALVPLKGTAPTNINFVAGDYNRKTGLKGDGSTKYLNSNRANTADGQNNHHQSIYVTEANSLGVLGGYIGAGLGDTGSTHIFQNTTPAVGSRSRSATANTIAGTGLGLVATARIASASYITRVNGANTTFNTTSQVSYAGSVYIYARQQANVPNNYSNGRLSFYSIGGSLATAANTATFLDNRVTTLMNTFNSIIP